MALAGAFGAFLMASQAGAQNQFNPFGAFTDSGPVTKEEKARREQARTDLYDRLSPDYRMNVPFVSEAAIMGLQQAIQRYQQIVAAGGWPPIPDRVTLRQGDTSAEIAAIRQRLVLEGDLPQSSRRNPKFDQEFLEGVARFQIRHGLRVTGFVDSRTLRALNVSCLLYTSDAADDLLCVDLGGRRIIKKKKQTIHNKTHIKSSNKHNKQKQNK